MDAVEQLDGVVGLVRLQLADEVQLDARMRPRSPGHFAWASCTRFSPKQRWPAAISGAIRSAGWVLLTATRIDFGGIAPGEPGRRGDAVANLGESGGWFFHGPAL